MTRIDFGGAMLALLMGFILSAGVTAFLLPASGMMFPMPMPMMTGPGAMPGPGMMSPAAQAPVQAQAPAQVQAPAAAAPVEVKVVATDLKFTPPTIQAKVGQPIKIVLDNKGVIEHDIAFPTIKADKPANSLKAVAKPGQTVTLEVTPTAKGTYEYVCTIPGHKEAGMKGTITVN